MADLTESATETLSQMEKLESLSNELHQRLIQVGRRSSDLTQALHTKEEQFAERVDRAKTHVAKLDTQLVIDADRVNGKVTDQLNEVNALAGQANATHAATRARLKVLKDRLAHLTGQLETCQTKFSSEMAQIRSQTGSQLQNSAAAMDKQEESLRTATRKYVQGVTKQVSDRADKFKKSVENTLVPRIEADVKSYVQRVDALTLKLGTALDKAHAATQGHCQRRLSEFHQATATDWKGGSGDVEGAAQERATAWHDHGERKAGAIAGEAASMKVAADSFEKATQRVKQQYDEVLGIPKKIAKVLNKV